MNELLRSKELWLTLLYIFVVWTIIKALARFNKFILFIVLLIATAVTILYVKPPWLMGLWGQFN